MVFDNKQNNSRRRASQRPPKKEEEFDAKLVDLARVTRVSAGGRRFSFRATVVMGDKKGRVGVGVAKGSDVASAVEKAKRRGQKNMIKISIDSHTIPYEVEAKYGSSRVLLRPQRKGRGLVAGGAAREVCEKAGIKDISAKFISKTHNNLNNAMATMKALQQLPTVVKIAPIVEELTKKEDANTPTETITKKD